MEDYEQRDKRRNGSSLFNEPYSLEGIERLKSMIKTFEAQNREKFYSILVDNEVVVERNPHFEQFDDFKPFVNEHTRTVEVRLYIGSSPNCNRHVFHKSETTLKGAVSAGLQSVDLQTEIAKALAEQQRVYKLKQTQEKLRKKDKRIRKLKQQLADSTTGLEGIQDIAGKAVQLAGIFKKGDAPQLSGAQPSEPTVTIEAEPLSPAAARLGEQLEELTESGLARVVDLLDLMKKHPKIDPEKLIKQELKNKKNDSN